MPYASYARSRTSYSARRSWAKPAHLPVQIDPNDSVVVISFNKDISDAFGERIINKRSLPPASAQQQAIIHHFEHTDENGMIVARAGTGKSTTLEMLIAAAGFKHVESKTGHSVGFAILRKYRDGEKLTVLKETHEKTLLCLPPIKNKQNPDGMAFETAMTIGNIVSKVKGLMIDPTDVAALYNMCATYNIDLDPDTEDEVFHWIPIVIEKSLEMIQTNGWIDFDDMVYGPVALELETYATKYAAVLGDEAQDFNETQRRLLFMISNRLWFCGDDFQAMYAFRGALTSAMSDIAEHLHNTQRGLTTLPLTITRRCPLVATAMAREIVPDIECPDDAIEGTFCIGNGLIRSDWIKRGGQSEDKYATKFVPYTEEDQKAHDAQVPGLGDWIMCRTNAPLYKAWLQLLKSNIPATIMGRVNEAKTLKKKIGKLGGPEITDMLEGLAEYVDEQMRKLSALNKNGKAESAIEALQDFSDCVIALAEGCKTVDDIFERIDAMFENAKRPEQRVTLSTIHRAKGGEGKVIRIIRPDLLCKFGIQDYEIQQERNIKYVGITRTLDVMHMH